MRLIASRPYLLAASFSFSPACFRLADFFFAAPSAWAYGFPVAFPAARLAWPLAASAVFLALSRLLIRISLRPPRRRIRHQLTHVGFPGPGRPNPSQRGPGETLSRYRSSSSRMRPCHLGAGPRSALPTTGPEPSSTALLRAI